MYYTYMFYAEDLSEGSMNSLPKASWAADGKIEDNHMHAGLALRLAAEHLFHLAKGVS